MTSIVNFLLVRQLPVARHCESLSLDLAILERTHRVTLAELYVSKEVVMSCVHVIFLSVVPCASTELEKRAFGFASSSRMS